MRKEFSRKVKFAAFKRCCDDKGLPHCEKCGKIISAAEINFDHDQADGLGGDNSLENCVVLCKPCHGDKTHKHDNPIMKKADRVLKKTYKISTRRGPPIPGSKASGWKCRMDGTIVKREK